MSSFLQPLSLLLQSNPYINRLSLYDLQSSVTGVAKDLSHCSCSPVIEGFHGTDQLPTALKNSDVVVITAGKIFCVSVSQAHHISRYKEFQGSPE